jgi:NADH:ubiquinone oxidoreductase subunit 6 (subunit J)
MTEVSLFILVGAIAVVAAVMMLLSENAVHSALFLIVVMGCIAFLFLMLNAPFLAMVQITVYAGAIMVLFLFVIMLLGAEKLGGRSPFRWLPPAAMVLALAFFVVVGLGLGAGSISEFTPQPGSPLVRVVHLAPDAGTVDLRVSGVVVEEGLQYSDVLGYLTFPAGSYELALVTSGTDEALVTQTVELEPGFIGTVVAYGGAGQVALGVVADDLTAPAERSGRIQVFNGYAEVPAVSLVDFGSEFDPNDTRVLAADIALGSSSAPLEVRDDTSVRSWALIEAGNENNVLARLGNEQVFGIQRGQAMLVALGADRRLENTTRALALPLAVKAAPTFGSPTDVGRVLFSRYMLPMQAVAVLLLVAMVGAIILTHRPKASAALTRARLGRRRVSRPLTSVITAQVGRDVTRAQNGGRVAELPEPAEESSRN